MWLCQAIHACRAQIHASHLQTQLFVMQRAPDDSGEEEEEDAEQQQQQQLQQQRGAARKPLVVMQFRADTRLEVLASGQVVARDLVLDRRGECGLQGGQCAWEGVHLQTPPPPPMAAHSPTHSPAPSHPLPPRPPPHVLQPWRCQAASTLRCWPSRT